MSSNPRPAASNGAPASRGAIAVVVVLLLALVWGGKQYAMPDFVACPDCGGRGVASCGASGCERGEVDCPGTCLRASSPGWQKLNVRGHSADELWMRFVHDDGSWVAWNDSHKGEVIEKVAGRWVNRGRCPVCRGKTRVACAKCQGKVACERCAGLGRLRTWL